MPSVCFATVRLWRSWGSTLLLPILWWFLCDTLVTRHLYKPSNGAEPTDFNFHWRGAGLLLNYQLPSTGVHGYKYFIFHFISWFFMSFCTTLSSCVQYFFLVSFHIKTHYLWTSMVWFLSMCDLQGLLPTSGQCFMPGAPLELYLLRKTVMCSILILPTECRGGQSRRKHTRWRCCGSSKHHWRRVPRWWHSGTFWPPSLINCPFSPRFYLPVLPHIFSITQSQSTGVPQIEVVLNHQGLQYLVLLLNPKWK